MSTEFALIDCYGGRLACQKQYVSGLRGSPAGTDAALNATRGIDAAGHRGSNPAAATCAVGTERPSLPRASVKTVDRGSFGPVFMSSTLSRFRHFAAVLSCTQFSAQLRERSLRSLYCCSSGIRGRGASMANLSHRASFHSFDRIAPSNHGIKQLGTPS